MKNFRYFAAVVAMAWVTSSVAAFVPHVDLKEAVTIAEGQCNHEQRTYKCFILAKDTEFFIVAVDNIGIVAVYSIKELKDDYDPDDATLVWSRTQRRWSDGA